MSVWISERILNLMIDIQDRSVKAEINKEYDKMYFFDRIWYELSKIGGIVKLFHL